MRREGHRLTCKFYTAFLLWTAAIVGVGYFIYWKEIEKIRDLIPEENREGTNNCYDNPLLNVQIWTKESHFYPFYKMQDVVEYFDCLEDEEAIDEVRFYYISSNIGALVLIMGFISFVLVITRYPWRYAIELVILPLMFGIGEGIFIYFLAGKYEDEGVGGLSEIHCQLCSSVGLIFWVLFTFILLICIYGLVKVCCKCSKDRQKGRNIGTIREKNSQRGFRSSESEMQPGKANSGLF